MKEQSITFFTSFFMLSWWFYECWVYKLFVDRVIERQSNIRTFLWRVFECIGQQMRTNNSLTCPLVNLSTRNFVTQKNLVHLLLCLSIILSFLASNSLTCLLAFPHPEKTLHSLKQITLKSIQKPSSRATLQPTENQIVIKP